MLEISTEMLYKLRRAVESRNWDDKQLAEELHVSQSTVSRWLSGRTRYVRNKSTASRVREFVKWSPSPQVGDCIYIVREDQAAQYIGVQLATENSRVLLATDRRAREGETIAVKDASGKTHIGVLHWIPAITED